MLEFLEVTIPNYVLQKSIELQGKNCLSPQSGVIGFDGRLLAVLE